MLKNRPHLAGTLLGFIVALLATYISFNTSFLRKLELQTFDQRMVHFSSLMPDPRIVHIDIDDSSLERIGRWPWPRKTLADLVLELNRLGAESIIVDLLLSEHERDYTDNRMLGFDSDIEPTPPTLGKDSGNSIIHGDLELAEAIRVAGNVIMAAQLNTRAPGRPPPISERVRELWQGDRDMSVSRIVEVLSLRKTGRNYGAVDRARMRLRIRELLLQRFTMTAAELAEQLGETLPEVEAVVAGVKREVALELVAREFNTDSVPTLADVRAAILKEHRDRWNSDRMDIQRAYREQLGLIEFDRFLDHFDRGMARYVHRAIDVVPLYFEFALAARDIAAVNFTHDIDHGVRRVPIVFNYQDRIVKHMGFAAAADILDLDTDRITMPNRRTLLISRREGQPGLQIPLDGAGNLIIPWTRSGPQWRRNADFTHIPAAKILALADMRRQVEENEIRIQYHLADVVAASKGEVSRMNRNQNGPLVTTFRADHQYRQRVRKYVTLSRRIHLAELRREHSSESLAALRKQADELRAAIETDQKLAISHVRMMIQELDVLTPEEIAGDPKLKQTVESFRSAHQLIENETTTLKEANQGLRLTIRNLQSQLADRLGGKFVFIGYAATAEGDIVPTPIDERTNGVMCHANVLNAFLQNYFISCSPVFLEMTVCLLFGATIGFLTATRDAKRAFLASMMLIIGYIFFNGFVLFRIYTHWFALVPIVFTGFMTWALVTLFRQLTAERDKRHFKKQLSQYTSPAIADRIAESPEAAAAFKAVQTRDVTCLFSDLRGFTAITEREDAEIVQRVLNTYLERMSRVIWDHRGLINKFMGDGIMAFFNPSVDPLPGHPRVACETALEMFAALERLKAEEAAGSYGAIFGQLQMRVGVATGLCKNGDMGSELKADYTVIGDVVNLA
ncbi:MAG: CHASE2 domain-containing protein, partial [Phycisphaerae bacterium]